jgi:hypothetical protein
MCNVEEAIGPDEYSVTYLYSAHEQWNQQVAAQQIPVLYAYLSHVTT